MLSRCCPPSPPAAMAAVVLVPVPGSPAFAGCFRRWRRDLQLLSARPEGPGGVFCAGPRRPSGPCAGGGPRGLAMAWPSFTGLLFPALPLNSPAHGGRAARQHRQRASRSLPQKRKHPGNPGRPVAAVARAAPGVAGGGRGGPSEAAVFAGTDASAAPPLLPVPVCRPHVYRAKLNTTASGRIYPAVCPAKCQQRFSSK